jgi:hypothetical protein
MHPSSPTEPAAPAWPSRIPAWIPWTAAALGACAALWGAQRWMMARTEATLGRTEIQFAQLALKDAQQRLEAERIVARHQIADNARQLTAAEQRVAALGGQLDTQRQEADRLRGELAAIRGALLARDTPRELPLLQSEIDAPAGLANCQIALLSARRGETPPVQAIVVWNPNRAEGVLASAQLPAPGADQDYQLWALDPQSAEPVDGGVFAVDPPAGAARYRFKAASPLGAGTKFVVRLERKGGGKKPAGPIVLRSE